MNLQDFTVIDFAVVAVALVIAIVIIKVVTKIVFKLILFGLVAGFVVFFLFYWRGGAINAGNGKILLYEWKQKYCIEKQDDIKCKCIIEPLLTDFSTKYSQSEIEEFKTNKVKEVRALLVSINKNKKEIKERLRKEGALDKWDEFIKEINSWNIDGEAKRIYNELNEN